MVKDTLELSVVCNQAFFTWGVRRMTKNVRISSDGIRYVIISGDKVYLKGLNRQ